MFDWKIIAAVGAGLLLVFSSAFGLLSSDNPVGNFIEKVKKKVNDIIPVGDGMSVERGLDVKGNLAGEKNLKFSDLKAEKVKVYYQAPNSDVFISKQKFSSEGEIELNLEDYSGEVDINSTSLDLDGKAATAKLKDAILEASKNNFPVKTDSLQFEKISFVGIERNLAFDEAKGELDVNGKVNVEVDGEKLEIDAFKGDMTVKPKNINFDGKARRVFSVDGFKTSISS